MRDLVRETTLTANDFMVPLFIVEGTKTKTEIPSMPDYFRFSLDLATAGWIIPPRGSKNISI